MSSINLWDKAKGGNLPRFTDKDMTILGDIRKSKPVAFYYNATRYFLGEMWDYVKDIRCWRNSFMGETRGGKSECAQTVALTYCEMFNYFLKTGVYDKVDVFTSGLFEKKPIVLDINHICSNQSNYIFNLREDQKNNKINFGQIWIIDETRKSTGGIGSFSELIDQKNVNNIIAKFMQAELWLDPLQFEANNCPYGLYVYKKDVINRVNWCMLYRIQRTPTGGLEINFMGWVKIPLHDNEELRHIYNDKKNTWIVKEMEGSYDDRMMARKRVADALAQDPEFSKRSITGKSFILSKVQQITVLEDWIADRRTQNWNQLEKMAIVEEARRIADNAHEVLKNAKVK